MQNNQEVIHIEMSENQSQSSNQKNNNKNEQQLPNEVVISIKNVHKTYLLGVEGVTALRGVSFDVYEGEFIMIVGTSGGGKTTLLNIMGTIDKPTKGDVFICGQKIKSNTEDKFLASLRLTKLGFVFQTFNLISSLTAIENVELPMILCGILKRDEIRQRAQQLLTDLGLKERYNHFPNQLSGGEQQRVTICRALANEPKILFLDEPTGDLDTKNSDNVMKILLDLNKKGITMCMVTHDIQLKQYANRIVKLMDGKISGVEQIKQEDRNQSIQKLNEIVEGICEPQEAERQLGVRTGMASDQSQQQSQQQQQQQNGNVIYRNSKDYAVFKFQNKQPDIFKLDTRQIQINSGNNIQ